MATGDVDPVEFGKMIGAMEHLVTSITTLTMKVEQLETRLDTGRGVAIGLMLASASIGGGVGAFAHKFIEVLK